MIYINEGLPSQREATNLEVQEIIKQRLLASDIEFLLLHNEYCLGKLGFHAEGEPMHGQAKNIREFAIDYTYDLFNQNKHDPNLVPVMDTVRLIPEEIESTYYSEAKFMELFGAFCKSANLTPEIAFSNILNINSSIDKNVSDETERCLIRTLKTSIRDGNFAEVIIIIEQLTTPLDEIKISSGSSPDLTPFHYALKCHQNDLAHILYDVSSIQANKDVTDFIQYEEMNYIIASHEIIRQKDNKFNAVEAGRLFYHFNEKESADKAMRHIADYILENKTEIMQYLDFALHFLTYLALTDETAYTELKTEIWNDRIQNYLLEEITKDDLSKYTSLLQDPDIQAILPANLLCGILAQYHNQDSIICTRITKLLANKISEAEEFNQSMKDAVQYAEARDLPKFSNSKFGLNILKAFQPEELKGLGREKSGILLKPLRDEAIACKRQIDKQNSLQKKQAKPDPKIQEHLKIIDSFLGLSKGKVQSRTHLEVYHAIEAIHQLTDNKTQTVSTSKNRKKKAIEKEKLVAVSSTITNITADPNLPSKETKQDDIESPKLSADSVPIEPREQKKPSADKNYTEEMVERMVDILLSDHDTVITQQR